MWTWALIKYTHARPAPPRRVSSARVWACQAFTTRTNFIFNFSQIFFLPLQLFNAPTALFLTVIQRLVCNGSFTTAISFPYIKPATWHNKDTTTISSFSLLRSRGCPHCFCCVFCFLQDLLLNVPGASCGRVPVETHV